MNNQKGYVVITGVSTGIGYFAAKKFINEGYTVYGSVRKPEDADRLTKEFGPMYRPMLFDVTDHDAIQAAADSVGQELSDQGISALINNSGIAISGPVEQVDIKAYRYQFEVNYFGLIAVTKAFLPLLRQSKTPAKIINISSISSKSHMPFLTPYASSKAAVDSLTHGLRRELLDQGIDVIVMNPGPIETPIWDKAREPGEVSWSAPYDKSAQSFFGFFMKAAKNSIPADDFADQLFKTFRAKKPRPTQIMIKSKFKNYILPKLFLTERMYDRVLLKLIKSKSNAA